MVRRWLFVFKKVWSAKIDKNGRVTVPASLRDLLGVKPDDWMEFVVEAGELKLIKKDDEK